MLPDENSQIDFKNKTSEEIEALRAETYFQGANHT